MYTQCPDCSTAFRVTATVLKQAAGKVRCGGCGNAFNALEYLSESMPEQPAANDVQENLPELTPEPLAQDDGLPKSISAEQSAALLKTLDELAGSDIRIEDTGVEWRVLEEDEVGESAVDEVLEESPTPVDQFLTETPSEVDVPEIFDEEANDAGQTPVDELRFDDNTPLPDDFDFGSEPAYEPPPVEEPEDDADEVVVAEPQPDVDLSEPDEWTDILDEFDDLGTAGALPLDDELAALDEELAGDAPVDSDEEPASDDAVSFDDVETDDKVEPEVEPELPEEAELTLEATLADEPEPIPDIDDEPTLVDELDALDEVDPVDEPDETDATVRHDVRDGDADDLLDMDTQFALQAEAMGIDLSGIHDTEEEESAAADEPSIDDLLNESDDADREIDDLLDEELVDEIDEAEETVDDEELVDQIDEAEEAIDDEVAAEADEADVEAEQLELIDEAETDDDELAAEADDEEPVEEEPAEDESAEEEPDVPPLSEEEQTINMQIDAELMAIAVEDDDGFASTIIIPGSEAEAAVLAEKAERDDDDDTEADEADEIDIEAEQALKDTSAGFETIIMEGEEIRSGLENVDTSDEDKAAAAALVGAAAAEREAERRAAAGGKRWLLIAGAVVLALLLALQGVHQKRDVLAKIPAFNEYVGPLYRAVGQPLAPEWDITGWRFEATKGSTDESDENLTIYSRLGNKLDEPLPYPIIAISLTDRFEETIGSRILDPADYLANDLDPRKLVEPGNTFNAVMTIAAPDPDATGFKLNVCYRQTGGDLRCAIDDFK